jgi:hypothetical protein
MLMVYCDPKGIEDPYVINRSSAQLALASARCGTPARQGKGAQHGLVTF